MSIDNDHKSNKRNANWKREEGKKDGRETSKRDYMWDVLKDSGLCKSILKKEL